MNPSSAQLRGGWEGAGDWDGGLTPEWERKMLYTAVAIGLFAYFLVKKKAK